MVLSRHTLIGSVFGRFRSIMVFVSFSRRTECKFSRLVVAQLILNLLHAVYLVRTCICAWPNRLIVFDSEVDSSDGVFTRKDTDLMRGRVLETGCWRVEDNHLVVLLDEPLHVLLKPFFVFYKLLALHDAVLCIRCQSLNIVAVFGGWHLLTSLKITLFLRSSECQSDLGGSEYS